MQEVVHRCDFAIGTKGNKCGERVPEDEPLRFTINGTDYEADLCEKHQGQFHDSLAKFIAAATPVRTRSGSSVRKALKGKKGVFTTKDVREWLIEQGREVAPSGRLSNDLIEEYKAAHAKA